MINANIYEVTQIAMLNPDSGFAGGDVYFNCDLQFTGRQGMNVTLKLFSSHPFPAKDILGTDVKDGLNMMVLYIHNVVEVNTENVVRGTTRWIKVLVKTKAGVVEEFAAFLPDDVAFPKDGVFFQMKA